MTQYVCDRCGDESTSTHTKVEIPREYVANDSQKVDLCESCMRALRDFVKPLPHPMPNEQMPDKIEYEAFHDACGRRIEERDSALASVAKKDKALRVHDEAIKKLERNMQMILSELDGAMKGLALHPIEMDYQGFCISARSKEKLQVINEIIKRYES